MILVGCVSGNSTQIMATMSGMNAGASLGGAIGGLSSGTPRGHFMGTTIGALSGAAIGAIVTSPSNAKKSGETYSETVKKEKKSNQSRISSLTGLRRDVRVTNVVFKDNSGDALLQRGELAVISYDIVNVTPDNIEELLPKLEVKGQTSHIKISPMKRITNLSSGEGVRYTITIMADDKLRNSETSLLFYLSDDNGKTYTEMNTLYVETKK